MMLTRFALLAVVAVALASLAEAKREKNACGEALKPDNFREIIKEWKADCKDEEDKAKCMATKHGWVTDAGVFDETAFRTYIAGKIATASAEVKAHVEGAIDGCLTAKRMEKFRIRKIMRCIMKDC